MMIHLKRKLLQFTSLLSILILTVMLGQASLAAPDSLANWAPPQWQNPTPPGNDISKSTNDASLAIIRTSGNNTRLMIAYNQDGLNGTDPYYAVSNDNGINWSTPQPIVSTANKDSKELTLAFTGEKAHIIWVESDESGNDTLRALSEENNMTWNAANVKIVSDGSISDSTDMFEPSIVTFNNRIHVVWAEGFPKQLYHSWSDGGVVWSSPSKVKPSLKTQSEPEVTVDATGRAHIVWTELNSIVNTEVYYAQSTGAAAPYSWGTPVLLSTSKQDSHPNIAINDTDGRIRITFSRIDQQQRARQHVMYTECSKNCTTTGGWMTPRSITIQQGYVGANDSSPFNVISDLVDEPDQNTAYVYFHGYEAGVSTKEIIWGVNSCQNWSMRDKSITENTYQSLRPSITIQGDWLHIAYERIPSSGATQVYHRRAAIEFCPYRIYLPVLFK